MTEQEEKRLQKIQEKMSQLKSQQQEIISKKQQRKARTHCLIQNGALAEKYLGCEGVEPCQFEERLKNIVDFLSAMGFG